jgi:hypothetical protein
MLFLICTCGEILGNKQLVYEEKMKKVCEDLGVDFEMISQGLTDKNEHFKKARCDIVNGLCRRICCKQLLINYSDIVQLIRA